MTPPDTNSRTRYFYSDPVAACWMAKHFGMAFENDEGCEQSFDAITTYARGLGVSATFSPYAFYIHRDSLHLLEPIRGDVLRVCLKGYMPTFIQHHNDDYFKWHPDVEMQAIIQRKGMPFHWPEREEV